VNTAVFGAGVVYVSTAAHVENIEAAVVAGTGTDVIDAGRESNTHSRKCGKTSEKQSIESGNIFVPLFYVYKREIANQFQETCFFLFVVFYSTQSYVHT